MFSVTPHAKIMFIDQHSCALFPPSLLFGRLIYGHESCPTLGNLELVKELVAKAQRNVPSAGIWRLFHADPRPAR